MTRVLITGAAGFVGRALVDAYMREGCDVETLDVPGTGCNYSVDLDVVGENDWPFRLAKMVQWDIVICNAKCRTWAAHDDLARRARIAIVNVASIYGVVGPDPALYENTEVPVTPAWYAAAKGAMIALTRHQACTLAPVRSNAVILGGIERGHSEEFRRRYDN